MEEVSSLQKKIAERVQAWLEGPFDEKTKQEIRHLLEKDPSSLADAFCKDLSFGTGGMRGLMGVGTNRMNLYTVRRATQGLAEYLIKQPAERRSVFIGYDVRHHSQEFAEEAAASLESYGISVFLSETICPTPLVSFGCRYFGCQGGIMITASHNPPQYNGYKVYWKDGGQVVPPHDKAIMEEIEKLSLGAPLPSPPRERSLIHRVGPAFQEAYLAAIQKQQLHPEAAQTPLKILYTPLHGTGIAVVPQALKRWGYGSVSLVEEQSHPDGNFSATRSANPEEEAALEKGQKQMEREGADLLIATDPDADRVAVALRGGVRLTGNQLGCILLDHICSSLEKLPPNAAFVKSVVTTNLFRKIARSYGGSCIDVLTGFKYIAEKISEWEQSFGGYQFIFGAEESYGYLFGTTVRDKDAVATSCLIAEAAAMAKSRKQTLLDWLYILYRKHGIHRELLINLNFPSSLAGMEEVQSLMEQIRRSPPQKIGSAKVENVEDFLTQTLSFPRTDMLRFSCQDESQLVIRPSGTEPKVKIYVEVSGKAPEQGDLEKTLAEYDAKAKELADDFEKRVLGKRPTM